jgi:hypothetical protein
MKKLANLIAFITFIAVATVAMADGGGDGGGPTGTGHTPGTTGKQYTARIARPGGSWVELLRAALSRGNHK